MALHAAADHGAVQHVERREQRGGAMAFIVVRRGGGAARLRRQPWLAAFGRRDLAFFVNGQHDRVRGRRDVEDDGVHELGGEGRTARALEGSPVGEEVVRLPDALHRAQRKATRLNRLLCLNLFPERLSASQRAQEHQAQHPYAPVRDHCRVPVVSQGHRSCDQRGQRGDYRLYPA